MEIDRYKKDWTIDELKAVLSHDTSLKNRLSPLDQDERQLMESTLRDLARQSGHSVEEAASIFRADLKEKVKDLFHLAVSEGDTALVARLRDELYFNNRSAPGFYRWALVEAAERGDVELVRELRRGGLTLSDIRHQKNVALDAAVGGNHVGFIRELRGWGLNAQDARHDGCRPLRIAASQGHVDALQELRSWGLTLEDARVQENSALRYASKYGQVKVLKELRRWGMGTQDLQSRAGQALRWAAAMGEDGVIREFRENWGLSGKDILAINKGDRHGEWHVWHSPIVIAARSGHLAVLKEFRELGLNKPRIEGGTTTILRHNAWDAALRFGHVGILEELQDHWSVNAKREIRRLNRSTLKQVAEGNHLAMLKKLADWGVPFDLARRAGLRESKLEIFKGNGFVAKRLDSPAEWRSARDCLDSHYTDQQLRWLGETATATARKALCQQLLERRPKGSSKGCDLCGEPLFDGRLLLGRPECEHLFHSECLEDYWEDDFYNCPIGCP
jgi:hypothetical protein